MSTHEEFRDQATHACVQIPSGTAAAAERAFWSGRILKFPLHYRISIGPAPFSCPCALERLLRGEAAHIALLHTGISHYAHEKIRKRGTRQRARTFDVAGADS